MYAIYDYSGDANISFIVGVASTEALAEKAVRCLRANNPNRYGGDSPRFEELELDWMDIGQGWQEEKVFIPEMIAPAAYFTASFGVQGEIRLRQISEPKEFVLEMSKAVWQHRACWGENNLYGSIIQGEIKCIKADTEQEAMQQAEQERESTINKTAAFFVHRMGVFLITPLSMVRATTEVFGSFDEAHAYAKKEVSGYGKDPNLKVLSYAEAGRMFSRMEESRRIREKNINLLMTGKLPGQPVLCGVSECVEDDEHFS